jgi:hypothetical protein
MTLLVFSLTCPGLFVAVSSLTPTVSGSSLSGFQSPKVCGLLAREYPDCPGRTQRRRPKRFDRSATQRLSLRNTQALRSLTSNLVPIDFHRTHFPPELADRRIRPNVMVYITKENSSAASKLLSRLFFVSPTPLLLEQSLIRQLPD